MINLFSKLILVVIILLVNKIDVFPQKSIDSVLSNYQFSYNELMKFRGYNSQSQKTNIQIVSKAAENQNPLLFYYFEKDTLFVWLIRNSEQIDYGYSCVTVEILQNLEIEFKNSLGIYQSQSIRGSKAAFIPNSSSKKVNNDLCSILFPGNIKAELKNIRFLTVLPVLNIGFIPFYLLKPFGNDIYLIDILCINLAKSLDDFVSKSNEFKTSYGIKEGTKLEFDPLNPLIIGNPDFGKKCEEKFSPLPGAENEANQVAKFFQTEALTGTQVKRDEIIIKMQNSDFLYFATHGYANPDYPMDSGYILLAGLPNGECDYLTPKEIQKLSLNEDIVVLSACQTGLGKSHSAGTIGVGRAFLNAGAWNVIMSLWNVDDKATAELMVLFMEELAKPQPCFPAENLRQAMLKYKETHPEPAFWGAFVNFGSPYPIYCTTLLKLK